MTDFIRDVQNLMLHYGALLPKFGADGAWGAESEAAFRGLLSGSGGTAPDPELIEALKRDEGLRLRAYLDTVGVWTIGYGRAHVAKGLEIDRDTAERWLIEDVSTHNAAIHKALPWLKGLDPVRRRVLENMAFNLGVAGLLGFQNTLAYIQAGQYDKAADGMLASKWAKQVKGRAVRLAKEMRTGQ